ncbi:MAG: hypothetical protein ACRCZ6_22625 [Kluyvera sp.]|uniref:hypothetical protein n=1 Tax=Kluyvera sp. TaxID=1538228 RepID=UPI003F35E4D8
MKLYIYFAMLLSCGMVILTGCKDNDSENEILVVESFHNKFSSSDFNGIYIDLVSKEFKKSMTKSDYLNLMKKNRELLGKYQYGRLLKNDQIKVLIGENKTTISYHSTYNNYELNEFFVIKKKAIRVKYPK